MNVKSADNSKPIKLCMHFQAITLKVLSKTFQQYNYLLIQTELVQQTNTPQTITDLGTLIKVKYNRPPHHRLPFI